MNIEDIRKLISSYQLAISALPEVSRSNGFPVYPDDISNFMRLLESDLWVVCEYQPSKIKGILKSIESAVLEDVKWVLTAAARAERFCDGSWEQILKNKRIDPTLKRLLELHNE